MIFQSLLNPDSAFLLNLNWNTLLTFLHVNAVKNSILVFVKCFSKSSKELYKKIHPISTLSSIKKHLNIATKTTQNYMGYY